MQIYSYSDISYQEFPKETYKPYLSSTLRKAGFYFEWNKNEESILCLKPLIKSNGKWNLKKEI